MDILFCAGEWRGGTSSCALSEPDLNLSAHPAPIIQPSVLYQTANAEITGVAFWLFSPTNIPPWLDGFSTF